MAAAHVCDSDAGEDHTVTAGPIVVPVPEVPGVTVPVPARTPRSAGQAEVLHAPSNDHPPRMTPADATAASTAAHGLLAAV